MVFFESRRLADELAGVDVNRNQRFCLSFNDNRAAGFQPHLGSQRLVDLLGNSELLEQGRVLGIELDAPDERRLEALQEPQDALVLGLRVNPDRREIVRHLVAQDALNQVEVVIDQRRRLRRIRARLDIRPQVQQEA